MALSCAPGLGGLGERGVQGGETMVLIGTVFFVLSASCLWFFGMLGPDFEGVLGDQGGLGAHGALGNLVVPGRNRAGEQAENRSLDRHEKVVTIWLLRAPNVLLTEFF